MRVVTLWRRGTGKLRLKCKCTSPVQGPPSGCTHIHIEMGPVTGVCGRKHALNFPFAIAIAIPLIHKFQHAVVDVSKNSPTMGRWGWPTRSRIALTGTTTLLTYWLGIQQGYAHSWNKYQHQHIEDMGPGLGSIFDIALNFSHRHFRFSFISSFRLMQSRPRPRPSSSSTSTWRRKTTTK